MTVQELIQDLENFDPETEVRIAFQPSYPLAANVANVISSEEFEEDGDEEIPGDKPVVVWIAATNSVSHDENPYAPRGAWNR